MNLAAHNAAEDLAKRRRELGDIPALEELRKRLGLSTPAVSDRGLRHRAAVR